TLHPACRLHRIVDRNRIRHGADTGESARCSGRSPGGNCLLITLPGLTQMDMDIDQARSNYQAFCLDDLRLRLLSCGVQLSWGLNRSHPAVLEQDVAVSIYPCRRINQAAAA